MNIYQWIKWLWLHLKGKHLEARVYALDCKKPLRIIYDIIKCKCGSENTQYTGRTLQISGSEYNRVCLDCGRLWMV